jgi:hypothetical protein
MASFDWYQATIPRPVDDVLAVLSELSPGLLLSHERGMHGYASTAVLGNLSEGPVARVWYGGSHEYPHAVCSSDWAQPGAELIRAAFPLHTVSRVDVREDFSDEGGFDTMLPHLLSAAVTHRVKVDTKGDHLVTMKGRTVYLGAPSSAVRLRLYDKREEMLAKFASDADRQLYVRARGIPDELARLEAQIRPATKEAKREFASIEPVDALGCTKWMREVWKAVAGLDLTPVQVGRGYRQRDDERAYRYVLAQYGGLFRRMQSDLGSWECLGLQLGEDLE